MFKRSIYGGWPNLWLAALAMVATLPGRTQGLGLITEPLLKDLGMDRVDYASINLWATLIGALFCLPVGRLIDRAGSRIVLTVLLLALGGTVIGMSQWLGYWALAVAITLTRGFGQSALSVVSLALVGKWFAKRLPLAMGVYSLLVGIGFIAAFPSVGAAVQRYGWRAAWLWVGLGLSVVIAPVAWIVVRNGPDQVVEEMSSEPGDLTFTEALSSAAFWIFGIASATFGLVYSGIALFNQSILEQLGFDASTYLMALAVSTALGLLANFGGGWLASKWPIQRLMGVGMIVLTASLAWLPRVRTMADVVAYASAMGIAGGIVTVVFFSVWGQVFGRAHLGRIQGCAQMMTVLASAVGPLLLARTLKATGSYDSMFNELAVFVALLAVLCWIVPLPARKTADAFALPVATSPAAPGQ